MQKNRNAAFSLIEVIIALGIFSFAMVGIIALLPISLGAARSVSNEVYANSIAESLFEIWKIAPLELRTNDDLSMGIFIPGMNTINAGGVENFVIGNPNQTLYFDYNGLMVSDTNNASIKLDYNVGTDYGDGILNVNLIFSWPPNAAPDSLLVKQVEFEEIFVND